MTNPVFIGEQTELAGLRQGDGFRLDGPEGHHGAVVQRLGVGEGIDLIDGFSGVRLICRVMAVDGDAVTVEVVRRTLESAPRPRLVLVQALAKGDRSEQAIEFATELGVDAIVPWQAARSIAQWRSAKAQRGVEKWRNIARAAAKQARRTRIPMVHELVVTGHRGGLVPLIETAVAAGGRVYVLHEDADSQLSLLTTGPAPKEIWLIVGPEGGIADAERKAFRDAGALEAKLGPTVLRASSAGPAAITVVQVRLGRW